MNKIKYPLLAAGVSLAITFMAGCSSSKDNTLLNLQIKPESVGSITVADLDVSDKKAMGKAEGKAVQKHELEKEALAEALKQTSSDVLVGGSYFYEYSDVSFFSKGNLVVTVIGYPARYKNFRPKEVPEKADILIGGDFYYEDGKSNKMAVTVSNPKPVAPPAQNPAPPPQPALPAQSHEPAH
jgi:hypothetical protein